MSRPSETSELPAAQIPWAGVLLLDKPKGPGSHDLVQWVRSQTGCRAVGHCGTLDPAATGLLVVCIGPATKLAPMLTATEKTYRACFELGRSTDTADAAGAVIEAQAPSSAALIRVESTLKAMLGSLELPPPAYSAVRVDGQRAHRIARRQGPDPKLEPRTMELRSIEDIRVLGCTVEATLSVSKGTYIRSLAVELGRRLGTPAHLASLRRLACGDLDVSDQRVVGDFEVCALPPGKGGKPRWRLGLLGDRVPDPPRVLRRRLLSPPQALPSRPRVVAEPGVADAALRRLTTGQRLSPDCAPGVDIMPKGLQENGEFWLEAPQEPIWVLVRLERGPRGLRLAPARVLRA